MADAMIERLLTERERVEANIKSVESVAFEQKRDLTPEDIETVKTYSERLKSIDSQVEVLAVNTQMDASVRDRIAMVSPDSSVAGTSYRSAGEVLYDVLHQGEKESRQRFQAVQRRAAEHMGTEAAKTTPTAGGLGGLQVAPVTGPIIDLNPQGRPFLSAIGVTPAPQAFSFMRPRIVDPNLKSGGVATQGLQKEELASKKFDVKADTLEMSTVGGYLNVSQQVLSFTPNALDIIVSQLLKRLAYATEAAAIDVVTSTTNTVGPIDFTDGAAVRKAIFDASSDVYGSTGALPEWIAMGPAGWAALGSLTDLANRPLFPMTGPVNANGQMSPGSFDIAGLGIRGIVTPAITDDSLYVGNGNSIEAYEYRYPVLEAVEPSVLGRQVAVASSLVFYQPPNDEVPVNSGIVSITSA